MDPHLVETLSTLIDGETVDPDVLEVALRDPEATPLLVNAVRLRLALQAPATEPCAGVRRRCEAAMRAEAARLRTGWRRVVTAAALTAAVAGALAVGMVVGGRYGPPWGPAPTSTPAGGSVPTDVSPRDLPVTTVRPGAPLPAPGAARETQGGPQRTLRFDPARDWQEGRASSNGS